MIIIYSTICFGNKDISITDALAKSEISLYSQSGKGQLTTCGVEFNGIDSNLNYFSGTFALLYLGNGNIAPVFKLKSIKLKQDGSVITNPLTNIWLNSPNNSTFSKAWVSKPDGNEITMISRDVEDMAIFVDITTSKKIKIGYLHEGSNIDFVYQLKTFPTEDSKKAKNCFMQLTAQAVKANS